MGITKPGCKFSNLFVLNYTSSGFYPHTFLVWLPYQENGISSKYSSAGHGGTSQTFPAPRHGCSSWKSYVGSMTERDWALIIALATLRPEFDYGCRLPASTHTRVAGDSKSASSLPSHPHLSLLSSLSCKFSVDLIWLCHTKLLCLICHTMPAICNN